MNAPRCPLLGRPLSRWSAIAVIAAVVGVAGLAEVKSQTLSSPLPEAVGPVGVRPTLRRSVARRPEDAPPALPPSASQEIDQRTDSSIEPATFRSPSADAVRAFDEDVHPGVDPEDASPSNQALNASPAANPSLAEPSSAETNLDPQTVASVAGSENENPKKQVAAGEEDDRRRLRAPSRPAANPADTDTAAVFADFSWMPKPSLSMSSTVAATALTAGLLLLTFAVFRRALPKSARPLPQDVIRVLGRTPLANKQTAQLMRIGGKLVLVSIGVDGAKPITEITDPEEVARLTGLVEQASPQGASAAFQQVFAQVANEPSTPGFLGQESGSLFNSPPAIDRGQIAAAYANTPGGRANA